MEQRHEITFADLFCAFGLGAITAMLILGALVKYGGA